MLLGCICPVFVLLAHASEGHHCRAKATGRSPENWEHTATQPEDGVLPENMLRVPDMEQFMLACLISDAWWRLDNISEEGDVDLGDEVAQLVPDSGF